MKRFYSQCRIMLMTFALGLASVFILENTFQISEETATHSFDLESIGINQTAKTYIRIDLKENLPLSDFSYINIPIKEYKRFIFLGRGSYATEGFLTNDGHLITVYYDRKPSRKELKKLLKNTNILEKVENFKNRLNKEGSRIVAYYHDVKKNKNKCLIYWFDSNEMITVDAPTLELALEFERSEIFLSNPTRDWNVEQ